MAVTSFGTPVMTRNTAGSVTATWGTGQNRVAGHLLVAMVSAGGTTASAAAISTPAGWAQITTIGNNTPTANAWVAVYSKVAAGADAVPAFTATLSGTTAMTVTLLELAAAADTNPVDTSGTFSSGASAIALTATTVTSAASVAGAGEYAITCFAQEAAAAVNTWNGGGGWANAASDGATSSVLHTAVDIQANPASAVALSETGHWTTNATAFGAAILLVVSAQTGPIEVFTNNASTTITSGGTTAPAAGTAELWTAASWAGFPVASPSATPPTAFHIADPANQTELIQVVNTSTGLVIRGAEGTTPVAHSSGFTVRNVVSAADAHSWPQTYNVRQYGATGNGVTDDTAAINAAVTACGSAGGGIVYFPQGTYGCKGAINVNYSNVTLQGAGYNNATSIQYIPGTSRTAAIIVGVTQAVFYSNVVNLAVNSGTLGAAGGAIQAGSGHGIVFRSQAGMIRDVVISWPAGDGFHLSMDALPANTIYDVTMYSCYSHFAGGDCFLVDPSFYNCEFTVVKCEGGSQAGTPFGNNGFNIQATDCKFLNCHAYYCSGYGAIVGNGAGSSGVNFIGGEYETNNLGGIFIDGSVAVTQVNIIGVDFYGNNIAFQNSTPYGVADIVVFGATGVVIQDNLMISPLPASSNIIVVTSTGVMISNNAIMAATSTSGITVETTSTYADISHNYITTSTATPAQSIVVSGSTYCTVAYNTVSAGASEISAGNFNRIFGNLYTGATGAGQFALVGASSVAYGNFGTGVISLATESAPTFVSGTARQLSLVTDTILYIEVTSAATTLTVSIGPTATPAFNIITTETAALGLQTIRVPQGWFVVITDTMTNLHITAVTCSY